jgi:hypothetical protein
MWYINYNAGLGWVGQGVFNTNTSTIFHYSIAVSFNCGVYGEN